MSKKTVKKETEVKTKPITTEQKCYVEIGRAHV